MSAIELWKALEERTRFNRPGVGGDSELGLPLMELRRKMADGEPLWLSKRGMAQLHKLLEVEFELPLRVASHVRPWVWGADPLFGTRSSP